MTQDKLGGVLGALFVLFAILMLIIERSPPILAALCLLTALASVVRDASARAHLRRIAAQPPVALVLAATAGLCLWMLVTTLWSVAGGEAAQRGARVVLMIAAATSLPLVAAALPAASARSAARGAAWTAGIAIVLLLIETLFGMPLLRGFRYLAHAEIYGATPPQDPLPGITYGEASILANRLSHIAAVVAIMAGPLAAFMWRAGRPLAAAAVMAGAAAGLAGAATEAPFVALLSGVALAGIAFVPRWWGGVVAVAVAAVIVAMPLAAQRLAPVVLDLGLAGSDASVAHRLGIWANTAALIAERPLPGYGMEASRVLGRQGRTLDGLMPESAVLFQSMPLHPHNAALQVWLELGAMGAMMFAALCGGLVWLATSVPAAPAARAGALAALFSALMIAHVSFGIWQFWWIAALGIAAACIVLIERGRNP